MIQFRPHPNTAMDCARRGVWLVALSLGLCVNAHAQTGSTACGDLANGFGPYDYRDHAGSSDRKTNPNNPLNLVEGAHFRREQEALLYGKTGRLSPVGPEIDYTLRAFPNHHKALDAMTRLRKKQQRDPPEGSTYTVECWFNRAIRFRPDDYVVRMIYVNFLTEEKQKPEALKQLEIVLSEAKDNAFTYQNVGLLYFDLGEHQKALQMAHKAMELGLIRPELKEKLQAAGKWTDPVAASAEPAIAEPSAATSAPAKP